MNREKTIYGEYFHYPAATDWEKISARPHLDTQQLAEVVKDVLADIKANGDEAVRKYESKFDHVELDSLKVRADEINEAECLISDELKNSLLTAYHNIYTFHESQRFQSHHVETCPGVDCQRNYGRAFQAGKNIDDFFQSIFGNIHSDILLVFCILYCRETEQHLFQDALLVFVHRLVADKKGLALHDYFHLTQVVAHKCRTAADDIEDGICQSYSR